MEPEVLFCHQLRQLLRIVKLTVVKPMNEDKCVGMSVRMSVVVERGNECEDECAHVTPTYSSSRHNICLTSSQHNDRYPFGADKTFIVLQPGPSFTAFGIGENHPDDDEVYTTSRQRIRQAYRAAGRGYITPEPHLHRQAKQIVPGVTHAWWDADEDES